MANFPTHIAVGTIVSGALATVTVAADMVAPENVVAVTLAGVLGSVLPDIDLKDSRPSRAMFAGLAVFFSFAVLFSLERKYSIAEMLILWMGTLVSVRYVGKEVFFHFSYHRGIWHSLLAMCSAPSSPPGSTAAARPRRRRGLAGRRLHGHRLPHPPDLDEIYSVDVMDTRIKASFGTALKLVDTKHPGPFRGDGASPPCWSFLLTPPTEMFLENITSRALWTELHHRLLPPRPEWFQGMAWVLETPPRTKANASRLASPISTGSILPIPPPTRRGRRKYGGKIGYAPHTDRYLRDPSSAVHVGDVGAPR